MKNRLLHSGLMVVNCLFLIVNSLDAFNSPVFIIDSLIQRATIDTLSYKEKIDLSEKAFSLAEKQSYLKGQFGAGMAAGSAYIGLNQLEKAIYFFKTAYRIGEQMEQAAAVAEANYRLGEVYYYLKNYSQAKEAIAEALTQFEEIDSLRWIGIIKNTQGVILYEEGEKQKGVALYQEALEIFSQNNFEQESQGPLNNLADHYFHEGKIEQAQMYFEKVLENDRKYNSAYGETLSLLNIAWCFRIKKRYDDALNYIQESLRISEDKGIIQHVILAYSELSLTYKEIEDYKNALLHAEKYIQLKDSFDLIQKENRINDLMVQFETEKKEKQLVLSQQEVKNLQQQKKIQRLSAYLLLGFSCLSLLITFLFISRNRVKNRLAKSELQNQKLLSNQLQQQLDSKNQDLTNLALDISRKNEFSGKIHQTLVEINRLSDASERKKKIQNLLKLTSSHMRINEDAQKFQANIERVNTNFFNKLDKQFPGLTTNDKHLCGLIRLHLSSKDIASIKNISPKSVEMGRYRLRKKMNLKPEEDLSEYLQNFN